MTKIDIYSNRLAKIIIVLVMVAAGLYGCTNKADDLFVEDGPRYVRNNPENSVVLVFVHGVLGDSVSAWTNEQTGTYWPTLLEDDELFNEVNVYVYEYPTTWLRKTLTIDEVAEHMRLYMENDGITDHREIAFIVHSMGGLVTRSFLQKYQSVAERVSFIVFYGTPTTGAEISQVMALLSRNEQFRNMEPITTGGEPLANLIRGWQAARFGIRSFCAYEKLNTHSTLVVKMTSAAALCTEPLQPIDSNHSDIVKPENLRASSHLYLRTAFKETRGRVAFTIPANSTFEKIVRLVVSTDKSAGVDLTSCSSEHRSQHVPEATIYADDLQATVIQLGTRAGFLVKVDAQRENGGLIYAISCSSLSH